MQNYQGVYRPPITPKVSALENGFKISAERNFSIAGPGSDPYFEVVWNTLQNVLVSSSEANFLRTVQERRLLCCRDGEALQVKGNESMEHAVSL